VRFEELNLNKPLLNALNDQEFEYATPVQERVFPVIMSGRDVVGIAQTGTGKTLAYLLPLLRQFSYSKTGDPKILILVPTRELVVQVANEIKKLSTYLSLRVLGVYGGTNINTQKQQIYNGIDILVGTPGRLIDLNLSGVLRLKTIQKLVIDEVDEMLNLGFRKQLTDLMDMLPSKRQNLLFSATMSVDVENLFTDFFNNPERIEVTPHGTPIEKIIQKAYRVPNFYTKINLLKLMLQNQDLSKVLVFVNSKKYADKLFESLENDFQGTIGIIHSNKSQNFRLNAIKHFGDGTFRVLIATDIMARGLDISDVSHVINFDMPETPGDYIHRIGRTGRADKDGDAISFVKESELEMQMLIEQLMKRQIRVEPLPGNLVISDMLTEEERPVKAFDKDYLKNPAKKTTKGAFHEKKEKNKKVNLGGPKKRQELKEKAAKKSKRLRF
jgi:ATP-dependent RNA helicase RhlE